MKRFNTFSILFLVLALGACSDKTIIESDMGTSFLRQLVDLGVAPDMEAAEGGFLAAVPMGESGKPQDVASGIIFLASDASRYMTGAELVIDGGFNAT